MTEKQREYFRMWKKKNAERVRLARRRYYLKNKKALNAKSNLWWKNFGAQYRKNHPEYSQVVSHNRRARVRGIGGLTVKQVQEVYERNIKTHGTLTCYLCLTHITLGQDSIDHKIPLARGGTNEFGNLDIAHRRCNSRKHTKTEAEYRRCLS